ncbi:S9 family peptidase [Erythrobacteraceae bacterium WH01K]|nr:S9 family peptidase [Erythrobacteraceae bacterium WH01K]
MTTSLLRRSAAGLALAAALTTTAPVLAQDTRAMQAEDLVTMPRVGAPSAMPGGRFALVPVTETDPETFKRTRRYSVIDLQGDNPHVSPIALPDGAASVQMGGDGALYFLKAASSAEDGASAEDRASAPSAMQLHRAVLGEDGKPGPAVQLTRFLNDIDDYKLSADARGVVFVSRLDRRCTDLDCTLDTPSRESSDIGTGRLYRDEDGFVRHWDQWETPGHYNRAFAYELGSAGVSNPVALDGPAGGENALVGDTPTQPFGGTEDIAFSADHADVFFTARKSDAAEPTSTDTDIYRITLGEGATPVNLTDANRAADALPSPSPDGKWLAYAAMARPGYESDRMVIQLRDLATGETRALTQDFDRSFHSLAWTPDSRWIIATAQDVLDSPAFRIDPMTGSVERLDLMPGNEAHLGSIVPLGGGRLLFTRDSIAAPAEVYLSDNWQEARAVTGVATDRIAALDPVLTQRFSFAGAGGDTVWGQITKPTAHDGRLPAILYIHGGPQGSFNDGWSSRWNPRVLASQGYAVISVDFHGSTGYGQAFTDSINRDWGGKPLEDLQKGLAAALEQDSQIDGSRACAMGASYGGYMVNWIAGNWPDRFDCLIQHDGLFDMRMFYYTTEELWFPRWEFGGSYTQARETYERWNPVNHVESWRTPMLVIAGERDFRIPYTQGLASFTALQEQGVEAELLVFPDENHWVLGAGNSLQWHRTVFGWLDRWLKQEPQADSE